MKMHLLHLLLFLFLLATSCVESNPNRETNEIVDEQKVNSINDLKKSKKAIANEVYVPIYSEIYNKGKEEAILFSATLSLRNTSTQDTLFIENVDYYNTDGNLVKNYISEPIYLKPLESIDYVVDEKDTTGGSGANFTINWYAHKKIKPVFQAVMLGGFGNRTYSFVTNGVVVDYNYDKP